jgi:hypothetical protein
LTAADCRIEAVNPAFTRIIGYASAAATGKQSRIVHIRFPKSRDPKHLHCSQHANRLPIVSLPFIFHQTCNTVSRSQSALIDARPVGMLGEGSNAKPVGTPKVARFIVKSIKTVWLILALLGLVMCGSAWADRGFGHGGWHGGWHGGGSHFGVFVGAPLFWPYYSTPYPYYPYPYPYSYDYPPVTVGQSSAPLYIEQGQEQAAPQQYWYFCSDPKGYYPYVKQCPAGWQPVSPQAPSPK